MNIELGSMLDDQDLDKLLRAVKTCQRVTLTCRGQPVGVLLPYDQAREDWHQAVREERAKSGGVAPTC